MVFHFLTSKTSQVVGDECWVTCFTVPKTLFKGPRTCKVFQTIKQSIPFYLTSLYRLWFCLVEFIELSVRYIYFASFLFLASSYVLTLVQSVCRLILYRCGYAIGDWRNNMFIIWRRAAWFSTTCESLASQTWVSSGSMTKFYTSFYIIAAIATNLVSKTRFERKGFWNDSSSNISYGCVACGTQILDT